MKTVLALFALSFALCLNDIPTAVAWHLASKRGCLRQASAPDCKLSATAVCKARRRCVLESGKTINACVEWRCEQRK